MQTTVVGLGRMGRAIAGRLLEAGHDVTVWNRSAGKADKLVDRGAHEAKSVAAACAGKEVVLVSLTGDDAVREVVIPDDQPIAGFDGVLIDCSTVSPALSRIEADRYQNRFVACPIAGAPQAVDAGSALLIVGGAPDPVATVEPVLGAISESRRSAGDDPGAAAVIKLLNNYLLLAGLAVLADAVAVAQSVGLADDDVRSLFEDLPMVPAGLKNRVESLVGSDHEAWFSVDLGSKDLGLFTTLASEAGVHPGLLDAAATRYRQTSELGLGDRDLTAVIETLRRGKG